MNLLTLILLTAAIASGVYIGNKPELYEKILRSIGNLGIKLLLLFIIIASFSLIFFFWNQITELPLVKSNTLTQIIVGLIGIFVIYKESSKEIREKGKKRFYQSLLRIAILTIIAFVVLALISTLGMILFWHS